MDKRLIFLTLLLSTQTLAGPPFLTDDPETLQKNTWEDLLYAFTTRTQQQTLSATPTIEFNYGVTDNFKVTANISYVRVSAYDPGDPAGVGLSDLQIGFAYKFIQETAATPQVSFVPNMTLPVGNVRKALGNGRPSYLLPIWAQKSFGAWTIYGGGGYAINHAPTMRDYVVAGMVIQKDLNDEWTLGGEIYRIGSIGVGTPATTFLNFGGFYNIIKPLAVMFSAGHSINGVPTFIALLGLDYYLDLTQKT